MFKGFILGVFLTLAAGGAAWLVAVLGGLYDPAASGGDDILGWSLDAARDRSVSRRAGGARMPVSVPEEALAQGARLYAEACSQCHGAPEQDAAPWSRGMRPAPTLLAETAPDWSPEEIRWIVENGLRMSGMPAFGPALSEDEIVAVAAFVRDLPNLSAARYREMAGAAVPPD